MEAGISFGDNVRIIDTDETRQGGWAGLTGSCMGFTTPSITPTLNRIGVGGSRATVLGRSTS